MGMCVVEFRLITVTMVRHPRDSMTICKGRNRFIVPVELQNEKFGSFHDAIHEFDVVHVFLSQQETV